MLHLKVASKHRIPPTLLINATGAFSRVISVDEFGIIEALPQSEYTDVDLALLAGYQYFIDSLCVKCGTPAWYGRTEVSSIEFEVKHTTCYACAALEDETKANSKKKNYSPPSGQTSYAEMTTTEFLDGTYAEMPSFRELLEHMPS